MMDDDVDIEFLMIRELGNFLEYAAPLAWHDSHISHLKKESTMN